MQISISDHTRPDHIAKWLEEAGTRTHGTFKGCEVLVMGTVVNDDLRGCYELVKKFPAIRYMNRAVRRELTRH